MTIITCPEAHHSGTWNNPVSGDWQAARNNPLCGYWLDLIIRNNPPGK